MVEVYEWLAWGALFYTTMRKVNNGGVVPSFGGLRDYRAECCQRCIH